MRKKSSRHRRLSIIEACEPRQMLSASAKFVVTPNLDINASTWNTGSFALSNTSTTSLKLSKVVIDLSTAILPYEIWTPTTAGGDNVPKDVTDDGGGTNVGYSAHSYTKALDGGYQAVELDFTNFNPAANFKFSADIDPSSIKGGTSPGPNNSGSVSGLELSGSTVTFTYSDGTVQTANIFAQPSTQSGGQVIAETGLPAAPSIALSGVATTPTTLNTAGQTLVVTGTAGTNVSILDVEAGLYVSGIPGGGFDLHPYEANSVVKITQLSATIGSGGTVNVPVTLTQTDSSSGFNYFVAAVKQADGSTGATSKVVEVAYSPSSGTTSTPFSGTPIALPGTIMADNFDNGGKNVAYFDTTAGNQGGSYRTTDVDIEPANDSLVPPGLTSTSSGVGFNIGHTVASEWLKFTVNVATAGTYPLSMRVASGGPTGTFHVSVDGVNGTGSQPFPSTGSWTTWQTISAGSLTLSAGTHVLQLMVDTGSAPEVGRIEWLQVGTAVATGETPFLGSAFTVPTTIMIGNFDNGGQGVAYNDSTPGNQGGATYRTSDVDLETATDAVPPNLTTSSPGVGYNLGHVTAGEWLQYSINVPTTGTYNISVRNASPGPTGTFHIGIDGTNVTGVMNETNTGGWQTYTTTTASNVNLNSGNHILRLSFDTSSALEMGNFYWIQISSNSTAPGSLSWASVTSAPEPRDEGGIAVVNNKLYSFGGFNSNTYTSDARADVYDPSTNTWTRLADMPEPLTHAQTVVDGTTIWLVGGFIGAETDGGSSHVWKYDTISNTYTAGPSMPGTVGAAAVALLGRNIHVVSGLSATNGTFFNTTEHWVLNLDNQAAGWTSAAAMPRPRNHAGAVVFNNQLWVVGGQDLKNEISGNSAAVEVYDPTTNKWTEPGDLPLGRSHVANSVILFNGTVYVFGGENNGSTAPTILSSVLSWNAATSSWQTVPGDALPSPRKAPNVAIVGNHLIAFGGADPDPLANSWSAPLTTTTTGPFLGTPFTIGQTIQADNYDLGGEGVAYHDTTTTNLGGQYRLSDAVDVENTSDVLGPSQTSTSPGAPYQIGHIVASEWLKYTINVATTGTYSIDTRLASANAGGAFHYEIDGTNVSGSLNFLNTGGWTTYQTVTATGVSISAGTHVLRLVFDSTKGGEMGNVYWMRIYTPPASPATVMVASPTSIVTPTTSVMSDLTTATDDSGYIDRKK